VDSLDVVNNMISEIQRSDVRQRISQALGFTNPELAPRVIPSYLVPSLIANDKVFFANTATGASGTASNATTTTIHTTSSSYDTYLNSLTLSVAKDATSTSTASAITAVINGATVTLASIAGLTLTAQSASITLAFPVPIKLDRSSIIAVTNTTAVANVRAAGSVSFFLQPIN